MICKNPLVNDERIFILHARNPLILVELVFNEKNIPVKDAFMIGERPAMLKCIYFEDDPFFYEKIISRMQDWTIAYFNFLENSIGNTS